MTIVDDLLPGVVDRADYDAAIGRIAHRVAQVSRETGLYRFGGVGCPGISDVDLLCVVPDGLGAAAVRQLGAVLLDEPLATHGPFIVERAWAGRMPSIFPGVDLRHVSGPAPLGERLADQPDASEESRAIAIADVIEVGCRRWATLTAYLGPEGFGPRRALLTLWALTHLIESAGRVGLGPTEEHERFRSDAAALRTAAGAGEADAAEVQDLILRGLALIERLVMAAAGLAEAVERPPAPGPAMIFEGRSLLLPTAGERLALDYRFLPLGKWTRRFQLLHLPRPVFDHFARSAGPNRAEATRFDRAVAQRAAAIEAYRDFVMGAGCSDAALPPTLFAASRYRSFRAFDDWALRRIAGRERMRSEMSAR